MRTLGDALQGAIQGPGSVWGDEGSDRRRRVALAFLFSSLPSARMAEHEREAQLESYAEIVADLPPLVVELAVRQLAREAEWVPRPREIRAACAHLLREARWKLTGGNAGYDHFTEHAGFNAEAEIRWAKRNARALQQGADWPRLPGGGATAEKIRAHLAASPSPSCGALRRAVRALPGGDE